MQGVENKIPLTLNLFLSFRKYGKLYCLKYIVAVILSFSLYAPSVAKFLAYAECSALAVSQADQNWCDCMLTADTDTDGIPATEKQKDIAFKTDWKYTTAVAYEQSTDFISLDRSHTDFIADALLHPYQKAVFHPPLH